MKDQKRKRTEINVNIKNKICQLKNDNKHLTLAQLQECILNKMGISVGKSTLCDILKTSRRWLDIETYSGSRVSQAKYPELEDALFIWICQVNAINGTVTDDIIVNKGKKFAEQLSINNFGFSSGWLQNFKNRYNLKCTKKHGESGLLTSETIEQHRQDLREITKNYKRREIFNMDETGLVYNFVPRHSISNSTLRGLKDSKSRITIALCSNSDGSIKLKPFVIGVSKKPRCFKDFKADKHVVYTANKKAWMNSLIFKQFLDFFDEQMKHHKVKAILFIDNAPSHITTFKYDNFTPVYLPKNTTSVIQPMDAGIIKNFKDHYKRLLVNENVFQIDNKIIQGIDLKKAVEFIGLSWNFVTQTTILNCFNHTGIFIDNTICTGLSNCIIEDEYNMDKKYQEYADFLKFDFQLETEQALDDNEIINIVQNDITNEIDDNEKSISNDPKVTLKEAIFGLEKFLCYASYTDSDLNMQNENQLHLHQLLNEMKRKYNLQITKQTKITDFMNKII